MKAEKKTGTRPMFERMVAILHEFSQEKAAINARVLAERLECSTKTIYRDLDFIRDRLRFDLEYQHLGRTFKAPPDVIEKIKNMSPVFMNFMRQ